MKPFLIRPACALGAALLLALLSACGGGGGGGGGTASPAGGGSPTTTPTSPGAPAPTPTVSTSQALPLEVLGAPGTIVGAPFSLNTPGAAHTLKLTTHRLAWREDGEFASITAAPNNVRPGSKGSVRLNGGPWLPLTNATVSCEAHEAEFGCLNGSYMSVRIRVPIAALGGPGPKATGNLLEFRFDATDGISSGWRVLALDIVRADGQSLLPANSFSADNPDTWTPPLNTSADIAAGKSLWESAPLTDLGFSNSRHAIQGKCASCHFRDGSDLAYFNYSNQSIIVRSVFHGLSEQQGKQIASYIRSLDLKLPSGYTRKDAGRPWNPPYQPGPGLDSKPVELWAAGAGLGAVLERDNQMRSYLFPNGQYRAAILGAEGFLNPRETPQALQYPDWNTWLPAIAVEDRVSDPAALPASPHFAKLKTADDWLTQYRDSNSTWHFQQGLWNLQVWRESEVRDGDFVGGFWVTNRDQANRTRAQELQQTRLNLAKLAWYNLRMIEMQMKHRLQDVTHRSGMAFYTDANNQQQARGIPVGFRSWSMPMRTMFETAPHFVADHAGLSFNFTQAGNYLSTAWYSLEQVVNGGWRAGSLGLDWNYHPQHIYGTHAGGTGFYTNGPIHLYRHAWSIFWLYQSMPADWTPQHFAFRQRQIGLGLDIQFDGSAEAAGLITLDERKQLQEALALAFLGVAERYSPNQWVRRTANTPELRTADNFETTDYAPDYNPAWAYDLPERGYQADAYYLRIKLLKDKGYVTSATLNRLVNWGAGVWPKGNWNALRP